MRECTMGDELIGLNDSLDLGDNSLKGGHLYFPIDFIQIRLNPLDLLQTLDAKCTNKLVPGIVLIIILNFYKHLYFLFYF